jgi:hypothetical protein
VFVKRSIKPHEFEHAASGAQAATQPCAIEIDDDDIASIRGFSDQQILDVEIGVAAFQVVKLSDCCSGRTRRAQQPLFLGLPCQKRHPVQ